MTAIADSSARRIIWFEWSSRLADARFQFALPSDFCSHTFAQPDGSFASPPSNLSHFLSTSSLCPSTSPRHWSGLGLGMGMGAFDWPAHGLDPGWRRRESKRQRSEWVVRAWALGVCFCVFVRACMCAGEWLRATNRDSGVSWSSSMVLSRMQGYCRILSSSTPVSVLCGPLSSIRHHRDVDVL